MNKGHNIIRWSILIGFLILFATFSLLHQVEKTSYASVDALCPFGGIETLYTFITSGGFVPKILVSSLILAVGVLVSVIIFRRGFCGYVCPFGTIQEITGKITKIKFKVPSKIDKILRGLKYLILVAILIGTIYTGTLIFRSYDPFLTFFHFGKGLLWGAYESQLLYGVIILALTLLISIFIERAWCKYFCPLGATMAIFSNLGLTTINRNEKTCTNCKACDRACPMNINVSTQNKIKDVECINCNLCVAKCPVNSLSIKTLGKKINPKLYAFLIIFLLIAIVAGSMILGIWQSTPNSNIANKEGKVDPMNIKGWMTLEDIAKSTNIDLNCFINDLGLPSNIDPKTKLNEIGSTYNINFETSIIRTYIADYNEGMPICSFNSR